MSCNSMGKLWMGVARELDGTAVRRYFIAVSEGTSILLSNGAGVVKMKGSVSGDMILYRKTSRTDRTR